MKQYFLIIAAVINLSAKSQESKDSLNKKIEYVKELLQHEVNHKNEILINLTSPMMYYLGNSLSNKTAINLAYKRILNNRSVIRFNISLLNNLNHGIEYSIMPSTNSKLDIKYTRVYPKAYLEYKVGYEYRMKKRKLQQFTGVDFGYSKSEKHTTSYEGTRDSVNSYYGVEPIFDYTKNIHINKDSVINQTASKVNQYIITPFYGIKYDISKHFFLTAQLGFDFSLNFDKNVYRDEFTKLEKRQSYNYFDFNLYSTANSISLGYKF